MESYSKKHIDFFLFAYRFGKENSIWAPTKYMNKGFIQMFTIYHKLGVLVLFYNIFFIIWLHMLLNVIVKFRSHVK